MTVAREGSPPGRALPSHPKAKPWPHDHRLTPFQAAVVAAVEALEPGDLVTFGDIADQVDRPGAGQAVANVLRAADDLPWWRVLPGDGRVYRDLAPIQVPLLRSEGHRVDRHRRVHPAPPHRDQEAADGS